MTRNHTRGKARYLVRNGVLISFVVDNVTIPGLRWRNLSLNSGRAHCTAYTSVGPECGFSTVHLTGLSGWNCVWDDAIEVDIGEHA